MALRGSGVTRSGYVIVSDGGTYVQKMGGGGGRVHELRKRGLGVVSSGKVESSHDSNGSQSGCL